MLREYKVVKFYYRYYMLWVSENENCASNGTNSVIQKKGRVMQDKICYCYRVKLIIIGNMFYIAAVLAKNPWNTYARPFPPAICWDVEMLLQSCVATTTLQKGGGKQKGAEFSKVFQGFCLRLRLTTTWKTQKLVPSKKISEQQHFLFWIFAMLSTGIQQVNIVIFKMEFNKAIFITVI